MSVMEPPFSLMERKRSHQSAALRSLLNYRTDCAVGMLLSTMSE